MRAIGSFCSHTFPIPIIPPLSSSSSTKPYPQCIHILSLIANPSQNRRSLPAMYFLPVTSMSSGKIHFGFPPLEYLIATVLGVSASSLAALSWVFDRIDKALNESQRGWIFWIDIVLILAAPLSLLSLQTMTKKPKLGRYFGIASILCFIVALGLLLSFLLVWLMAASSIV